MGYPKVLVTGYPKFSNFDENISEKLIQLINDIEHRSIEVHTSLLSVDKNGSNSIAQRINDDEYFDAIIHLGFSNSREIISLERFSYNQYGMNEPDNSGRLVTSGKIIEDDSEIHETTAPIKIIDDKFDQINYVSWSSNPGRFVCNETYFRTLSSISNKITNIKNIPTIFIHLPSEKYIHILTQLEVIENIIQCMIIKPKIDVVGGLMFDIYGRILSCKRPNGGTWGGWWEFPGGKIEDGENVFQALQRELIEELDINVNPIKIEEKVTFDYDDRKVELTIINCGIVSENKITLIEHEEMRWLSKEELLDVKWLPADLPILEKWFNQGLPNLPLG
jgi:8-oxo-dGTP diphosphatase